MQVIFFTYLVTSGLLALSIWLIWAIVRLMQRRSAMCQRVRYRWFGVVSLSVSLLWGAMLFYGHLWGRWRHEVTTFTFCHPDLPPDFDGYRIVHISDLHLEGFLDNPAYLDTLIGEVNHLQPDLICFTGDLVSINHQEAAHFLPQLARLRAKDGVASVLGNHDYGVYDHTLDSLARERDVKQLITLQRDSLGWVVLLNEHITLHHKADSISLLGTENQNCGPHQRVRRGNLDKTLEGTEGMFRILLTHDPTYWDTEVADKRDIPLTLSGHTHAMQFRVMGLTPCSLLFPQTCGAYHVGDQTLYVNIGLGQLMPFRIGATPEITLITLRKSYGL